MYISQSAIYNEVLNSEMFVRIESATQKYVEQYKLSRMKYTPLLL